LVVLIAFVFVAVPSVKCLTFCDQPNSSAWLRVIGGTKATERSATRKSYILTGLQTIRNPQHIAYTKRIVVHPQYDASRIANDIALVQGDSGGPLLVRDAAGRLVQVGITSFGAGGGIGLLDQGTYPGVYTRVASYSTWIESVV
ncbi:hypothetical protein Angca_008805, partial [Angiostrongylus cantonensis]